MDEIELEIPDKPQSMDEIEFNYKTKAVYRSSKYKKRKAYITECCQTQLDELGVSNPLFLAEVPLELSLELIFEFTTDMFVSANKNNYLKEPVPHWYMKKIDIDNILKITKDGMSGVVYEDDSQVCQYGTMSKVYGYCPSTIIKVKRLPYFP